MTILNTADALYLGDQSVDAIYAGAYQVWPIVRGPELVTNGTFDNDVSGWTNFLPDLCEVLWEDGRLLLRKVSGAATGNQTAYQNVPTVPGKWYHLTALAETATTTCRIQINPTYRQEIPPGIGPVSVDFFFLASSTSTRVNLDLASFGAWHGIGAACYFDNVSVKEAPDHAG